VVGYRKIDLAAKAGAAFPRLKTLREAGNNRRIHHKKSFLDAHLPITAVGGKKDAEGGKNLPVAYFVHMRYTVLAA